ncbi:DUF2970 domain-containing protein [Spongiibacter sp. KMU-158]|uniref:DUF2970 domain-containing protein n=1 Tax=Spongiibacter pelagi TaxID=2760804 RepID=A0A927C0D0_9GAMM|nr:DUF2970 domain-containing protein [Spongiibacter pelagi]MBD2858928.1 DUF2970 domain-containing protein [Spongiibacter pelagi]
MSDTNNNTPQRTPLQVFGNIAAVAFAVRTDKKSGNDFREGSFKQFVFGSLVFTAVFITAVVSVVKLVLP